MRLSFLVESPILYLAFVKTILAALFRAFGLPLNFLHAFKTFISPWSFYHPTLEFFQFFSNFYNRQASKSKYTGLCSHAAQRFCAKGVYLSSKTRKEFEQFGLQNTKNMWLENILAHAHLWRGTSTQIEYSSQKTAEKMAQQVWK